MANERNVEALDELIGAWVEHYSEAKGKHMTPAAFLASRGVLVPSAMTDNEAMDVGQAWELNASTEALVGYLERIAKGDPS